MTKITKSELREKYPEVNEKSAFDKVKDKLGFGDDDEELDTDKQQLTESRKEELRGKFPEEKSKWSKAKEKLGKTKDKVTD